MCECPRSGHRVLPASRSRRSGRSLRAPFRSDASGDRRLSALRHDESWPPSTSTSARSGGRSTEAVFAKPNCARGLPESLARERRRRVDGSRARRRRRAHARPSRGATPFAWPIGRPVDVAAVLRESRGRRTGLLPARRLGAARCDTTREACLEAGVALVNCVPVFIASDPAWADRFRAAGLPLVGRRHQEPGRRDDRSPHAGEPASPIAASSSIAPTSSTPAATRIS